MRATWACEPLIYNLFSIAYTLSNIETISLVISWHHFTNAFLFWISKNHITLIKETYSCQSLHSSNETKIIQIGYDSRPLKSYLIHMKNERCIWKILEEARNFSFNCYNLLSFLNESFIPLMTLAMLWACLDLIHCPLESWSWYWLSWSVKKTHYQPNTIYIYLHIISPYKSIIYKSVSTLIIAS